MAASTRLAIVALLSLLAGTLAGQSEHWSVKSGFVGRQGHTSFTFNGRMWVCGGLAYSIYKNDVWSSANGQDWTLETPSAPWSGRHEHASVVFNNRVWVFGGVNRLGLCGDIWSSSDAVNWTLESSAAPWGPRAGHAVAEFNGKLWLTGGYDSSMGSLFGSSNEVWSSQDGVNWTQEANAPWVARNDHASVVFNNELLVIAGSEGFYYRADIWAFDGSAWTQRTGQAWPGYFGPRTGLAALVYNNTLWVIGGECGLGPFASAQSAGEVWSSSDAVSWTLVTTGYGWSPRAAHTALAFNNRMWILGGIINGWSGGIFGNVQVGEESNDVWSSSNGMIWNEETPDGGFNAWSGRASHTAVELNGKLWVMGGLKPKATGGYESLNDVWSSQDAVTWNRETAAADWAARFGHTSVAFNNKLWVFGGEAAGLLNDAWSSSDGINWAQSASNWPARKHHATVVFQGKLWLIGGQASGWLCDVWSSADGANWTLETASPGWAPRAQHSAVVFNNRIWLLGGWNGVDYFHDTWSSADGVHWTLETAGPMWSKRYGHASTVAEGRFWMFGGKAHPPGIYLSGVNYQAPNSFVAAAPGVPSGEQSFSVTAVNMSSNLIVTPPAEFEVAKMGGTFQSAPVSFAPTAGSLAPTTVRFRYNPAGAGAHQGNFRIACGSYVTTLPVLGATAASGPVIRLNGCVAPFNPAAGMPTAEQTYVVEGAGLTSDLVVAATSSFEVALAGGAFSASAIVAPVNGIVPPTTIRVRYNLINGWKTGFITHSSTGAVSQLTSVCANDAVAYSWPREVNDVWSSADGVTWAQEPLAPFNARIGHTLTSFNGALWMLGGAHLGYSGVTYQHTIAFPAEVWRGELPALQHSSAVYSVSEGAGSVMITAQLNGTYAFDISVDYSTASGTADAAQDYAAAAGTLVIAAGQTSASFLITIIDDGLDEPDETLFVSLQSPVGAALGGPAAVTVQIIDDDGAPSLRFAAPTYSVSEAGVSVALTIELSNASGLDVAVDYASSDQTACVGLDYLPVFGQALIVAGLTSATVTAVIAQDDIDEIDEAFEVSLSNPQNAVLGAQSGATVTILDDDAEPEISLLQTAMTVNESDGIVTVVVTLSRASSRAVSVDYATGNGSATAGIDYVTAAGSLTFAPGSVSQVINIAILDDDRIEPAESFDLALSNPVHGLLAANPTLTLTLAQDPSDLLENESGGGCTTDGEGKGGILLACLLLLALSVMYRRLRRV